LCVRRIVELLGPDYPIISIDPHGRRGEPVPPSIEKIAADGLPLILERQASGPFLLGGKCNGAMHARVPGAAILTWAEQSRVDWHYIAPGKPCRRSLRSELRVRSCVVVIGPPTSEGSVHAIGCCFRRANQLTVEAADQWDQSALFASRAVHR
jgi:hypothetical protein